MTAAATATSTSPPSTPPTCSRPTARSWSWPCPRSPTRAGPSSSRPPRAPTRSSTTAAPRCPMTPTSCSPPALVLKLQNASLFVQQQGSSIQVDGGPNPSQQVTFTSYSDNSVGGETGGDPTAVARGRRLGRHRPAELRRRSPTAGGPIPEASGPVDPLYPSLGRLRGRRRPVLLQLRQPPLRRRPGPADPRVPLRRDHPVQQPAG